MFGLFKSDPTKKMRKEHKILMEKAVNAQRNGKMAEFAKLSAEAEKIYQEILKLEKEADSKA